MLDVFPVEKAHSCNWNTVERGAAFCMCKRVTLSVLFMGGLTQAYISGVVLLKFQTILFPQRKVEDSRCMFRCHIHRIWLPNLAKGLGCN